MNAETPLRRARGREPRRRVLLPRRGLLVRAVRRPDRTAPGHGDHRLGLQGERRLAARAATDVRAEGGRPRPLVLRDLRTDGRAADASLCRPGVTASGRASALTTPPLDDPGDRRGRHRPPSRADGRRSASTAACVRVRNGEDLSRRALAHGVARRVGRVRSQVLLNPRRSAPPEQPAARSPVVRSSFVTALRSRFSSSSPRAGARSGRRAARMQAGTGRPRSSGSRTTAARRWSSTRRCRRA